MIIRRIRRLSSFAFAFAFALCSHLLSWPDLLVFSFPSILPLPASQPASQPARLSGTVASDEAHQSNSVCLSTSERCRCFFIRHNRTPSLANSAESAALLRLLLSQQPRAWQLGSVWAAVPCGLEAGVVVTCCSTLWLRACIDRAPSAELPKPLLSQRPKQLEITTLLRSDHAHALVQINDLPLLQHLQLNIRWEALLSPVFAERHITLNARGTEHCTRELRDVAASAHA